jgi:hypothetical protein
MLRIVLIAIVATQLATLSIATATEASATTDTFVGWSQDGKTYAVIQDSQEGASLLVIQDGVVVLRICEAGESNHSDDECKDGKGVKAVSMEMTRINVKRHKYLKDFALKRVSSKWRKAFRKSFMLRGKHPGKDWRGEPCQRGWKLLRRGDKNEHASEKKTDGCLVYKGGYLHPNGKYVLVKQVHDTWASEDEDNGFWSDEETNYKFIALKVPVLPSPEETDKP